MVRKVVGDCACKALIYERELAQKTKMFISHLFNEFIILGSPKTLLNLRSIQPIKVTSGVFCIFLRTSETAQEYRF